jgi:hypothetical protein
VGDPDDKKTERGNAASTAAPETKPTTARRSNQTRRAHARARMALPPPPHDQFVQNFFLYGLARSPNSEETTYWYDQLRRAYPNGATSLKLAGIELGRTLFESAEYAARNRDAHWYVYDLYKTYLMWVILDFPEAVVKVVQFFRALAISACRALAVVSFSTEF